MQKSAESGNKYDAKMQAANGSKIDRAGRGGIDKVVHRLRNHLSEKYFAQVLNRSFCGTRKRF